MKLLKYILLFAVIVIGTPACAGKTAGQSVDDSAIQAEVKTKIMSEDVKAGSWDINLETRKGVVQLGGFVDDAEAARKAAAEAATVKGVVKVDNQLHQKPGERSAGQVIDDGVTTTRIKSDMAGADLGESVKVNVDTYNGTVLLTGFVDKAADKQEAEAIAAKDKNTKRVINGIYVLD